MGSNKRDPVKRQKKRIKEGAGQGSGPGYKPAIRVHDMSSTGESARVPSAQHGRDSMNTCLSKSEQSALWYTIGPNVVDSRMQEITDLDISVPASEMLGFKHPSIKGEHFAVTTDLVVDFQTSDGGIETIAYSIKPVEQLENDRVLEKLSIEYASQVARGRKFKIITSADFPEPITKNLEILYPYYDIYDEGIGLDEKLTVARELRQGVFAGEQSLADLAENCDEQFGWETGQSLRIAFHLVARGFWDVNLHEQLNARKPLALLSQRELPEVLA